MMHEALDVLAAVRAALRDAGVDEGFAARVVEAAARILAGGEQRTPRAEKYPKSRGRGRRQGKDPVAAHLGG